MSDRTLNEQKCMFVRSCNAFINRKGIKSDSQKIDLKYSKKLASKGFPQFCPQSRSNL